MRRILFVILLVLAGCRAQSVVLSDDPEEVQAYAQLERLASVGLNFSTAIPADSIIRLGQRVEGLARRAANIPHEFKAGQVLVNAYGLTGNFGLAAGKAQQLLDKAREIDDPLALGLAIQAIGDTYMHSDYFGQADSVFQEAAHYILPYGTPELKIQLLFNQLHSYSNLDRPSDAARVMALINAELENNQSLVGWQAYVGLLACYEASEAIQTCDTIRATELIDRLRESRQAVELFPEWIDFIEFRYCMLTESYDRALAYNDTLLSGFQRSANAFALRNILEARASLLEKMGQPMEACGIYSRIADLTDSLYKQQYTSQVDSLHMIFWVDHLHTENVVRRNELYTNIIVGLVLIVIATAISMLLIRRKNRRIEASRLALQRMREATADSIRTKSLFLSNMSHELRTPLNAIVGFSSILTGGEEIDDDTRRECSEFIHQNADLLLKLINDVVDFSNLQGTSIQFTYAPCDVVVLCRNVLHTVENVKRTQALMHFETDLQTLEIDTDKNRLQQVLINLLVNATKFTQAGDITLRLSVDPECKEAIFSVEDTGCGIPLEKQPHIFERFEKLHEGVQGAGLGLSICKLIVERGGGSIWIDSLYTRGARFVFTHPVHFNPQQ